MKTQKMTTILAVGLTMVAMTETPVFAKNLAKVNGRIITDRDLNQALGNLNEGQRQSVLKDLNSRTEILQNVVDQEVLAQEAEKLKLDQEPEFKDVLAFYRKQLLVGRLLNKKLASQITESAAKKYYEGNKTKFGTDQIHVQHILLSSEQDAREVLQKAKGGEDFQKLAEEHSRDPSVKNNRGDLGFVGRDRMVSEFMDAAFSTKDGEYTGPVKTAYGYHVIKVMGKKIGKPLEFNEVELRVRQALQQELSRNYADNLRKQAKVEIDQKAVEKF